MEKANLTWLFGLIIALLRQHMELVFYPITLFLTNSFVVHLPWLDLHYIHPQELNSFYLCITRQNFLIKSKSCTFTLTLKESQNINSISNTKSFPKHWHINWSTVSSTNYVRSIELSCERQRCQTGPVTKSLCVTDYYTPKNHLMAYAQHTHCTSKHSKNRSTRKSRSHKIPHNTWKHRGFIILS